MTHPTLNKHASCQGRPPGFTLIELLVVISIIALLIGILLPVMGKARQNARDMKELVATKQLYLGYVRYAMEHKNQVIPGFISNAEVTQMGGQIFDKHGVDVGIHARNRWPWRLSLYLEHGIDGSLLVNDQSEKFTPYKSADAYSLSLFPSFGLNMYNIGGDTYYPVKTRIITRIDHASNPAGLMLFASAWAGKDSGHRGSFSITPPTGVTSLLYGGSVWTTADIDRNANLSFDWGMIDARCKDKVVVNYLDGHSNYVDFDNLRDMRLWSDFAQKADDPAYNIND